MKNNFTKNNRVYCICFQCKTNFYLNISAPLPHKNGKKLKIWAPLLLVLLGHTPGYTCHFLVFIVFRKQHSAIDDEVAGDLFVINKKEGNWSAGPTESQVKIIHAFVANYKGT